MRPVFQTPLACRNTVCGVATVLTPKCHFNYQVTTVTKDELRAELERQEQRYKEVYGGEVTTYAAQPDPERKPWRKRASVLDQAFAQELQKMEKELKAEEP
ncbi:hypothetical protein GCM10009504_23940 [Pseudomonas laurentiana]|nr:hypothetical protein GCM10009504_23940 [Pseudomonas laurentiana]